MRVIVRDWQVRPTLGAKPLQAVGEVVREVLGLPPGEAGVAWVDDRAMAAAHDRFLSDPSTTDVLSFPQPEEGPDSNGYWGDVMVCTDQAARQARRLGHPYDYELLVLVLHGFLHLRGYDHTRDGGEMVRMEESLRPRCVRRVRRWR